MKLDLGCGQSPRDGFIGVDTSPTSSAQIKQDAVAYLATLPDFGVDEIVSSHFLEHLPPEQMKVLLVEVARVLKPNGRFRVTVPHFSNPFYYSDPTHRQYFGIHSMSYFCASKVFTHQVPEYARVPELSLIKVSVGFVSYSGAALNKRKLISISAILNQLINWRPWILERYERRFCWLLPIFEINFEIKKASQI